MRQSDDQEETENDQHYTTEERRSEMGKKKKTYKAEFCDLSLEVIHFCVYLDVI